MKHLVTSLAVSVLLILSSGLSAGAAEDGQKWQDVVLDASILEKSEHPRLFLRDSDIKGIKKSLGRNPHLAAMHKIVMKVADDQLENQNPLEYKTDEAGRSILKVSVEAVRRIVSLSYAYRITGNRLYLNKAEWNIEAVCNFPDWHPKHFLDPSEMSFAVAIAYDWLHDVLPPEMLERMAWCLRNYAMEEVAHGIGQQIYDRTGNWNQVCIACMTAASIATWELNPELSREIIARGIISNTRAAAEIYSPDGAFPEGPGYWEYGTCYQEYLNILLEDAFGTDFGLNSIEGFSKAGIYKAFSRSGAGHVFNYSDNSDRLVASPGLWYHAWKFGETGILYDEVKLLDETDGYYKDRRLLVSLISAYRLGKVKIKQMSDRLYVGKGRNHVLMAKSGWDEDGLYLGLKGGCASVGHSHMDAGSFVFDAYGSRWVSDYYLRAYDKQELIFRKLGLEKKDWAYDQKSYRWYLFQYNNRQHSTLSVNDKNHNVDGFASIVDYWDENGRLGGCLEMTDVFGGDLSLARRSVSIVGDASLEVLDELQAPQDRKASVRFTIVTQAKPQVTEDGIILSDGKTKMILKTDAEGARYRQWSSNPKDYNSPTAFGEPPFRKTWICGYEYEIPMGKKVAVKTELRKK